MKHFLKFLFIIILYELLCVHIYSDTSLTENIPLITNNENEKLKFEKNLPWIVSAADNALESGLSGIAVRLYSTILNSKSIDGSKEDEILLNYISALIGENQNIKADEALFSYSNKENSSYLIRRAIVDFRLKNIKSAKSHLEKISEDKIKRTDQTWFFLVRGLIHESDGKIDEAEMYFQKASSAAITDIQKTKINIVRKRNLFFYGEADENMVADLRSRIIEFQGQLVGFESARILAMVLSRLDRTDEAVNLLEEQLRYQSILGTKFEDQFLLFIGLLAGPDSITGNQSLQSLLSKKADVQYQKMALNIITGIYLKNSEPAATTNFLNLLNQLIEQPESHALLDELYYIRAQHGLLTENWNLVEEDARNIIDYFPGSPLKNNAIRLLAYLSWNRDPPQYRVAAGYINEIRKNMIDGPEKAFMGVLLADCFYLNGDFDSAADAYGSILISENSSLNIGKIVYQQVISSISAGKVDMGIKYLDSAVEMYLDIDPVYRWRAEWNIVSALNQNNAEEALSRVKQQLENTNASEIPPELSLRLMWLDAKLSIDLNKAKSETVTRCNSILRILKQLPKKTIGDEQRNLIKGQTLLLMGQALLETADIDAALKTFKELRDLLPNSTTTIFSYIVEARYYTSINQTVDAQQKLITLVDRYPKSEYAPIALWEAALNAEKRGINSTYKEALTILERLTEEFPESYLVYYARLKQGDISRKLNDFGAAQLIYENLINNHPNHVERYRADMSRADCFLAQASQNKARYNNAISIYERIVDISNISIDVRIEAGFKWAFALASTDNLIRAQEVYWLIISRFLIDLKEDNQPNLQGRYWLSKSIFELGALYEKENRNSEALESYQLILLKNLPGKALAESKIKKFTELEN